MTGTLASGWPYDADQNDPLTALRIPVTDSSPDRGYLAAFAGRTVGKRGDGDWVYRRAHWSEGPFWVPEDGQKLSLPQLLDSIETWTGGHCNPAWEAWKSAHPGVFPQEIQ